MGENNVNSYYVEKEKKKGVKEGSLHPKEGKEDDAVNY